MSNISSKENLKKVINKVFSLQFEDMEDEKDYAELIKICKRVEGINPRYWLILNLAEILFFDKDKLKTHFENTEELQYFDYLINKKNYANVQVQEDFFTYIDYKKFLKIFEGEKVFSAKEIQVLAFIAKIANNFKILFNCIGTLYCLKKANFVLPQQEASFPDKFDSYLDQLESFLRYHDFESTKEFYSLEYNNEEGFHFQEYILEDLDNLKNKLEQDKKYKDMKSFISKRSVRSLEVSNNEKKNKKALKKNEISIENTNEENVELTEKKKQETKNEESNIIITTEKETKENIEALTQEQEMLIKIIQNNIKKDYEEKINNLKKNHEEKINNLKKNHEEIINNLKKNHEVKIQTLEDDFHEQKKVYDDKIRIMKKKHQYDINSLNNQNKKLNKIIENIKFSENKKYEQIMTKLDQSLSINKNLVKENRNKEELIKRLEDSNNKINSDLNEICNRGLSKGIIDFLYYVFYHDIITYDITYFEKKNSIIAQIDEIVKENTLYNKSFLSNLIGFINKIYEIKIEGDDCADSPFDITCFFDLIGNGYEIVKNLLIKLDLSSLLGKFNELYKQKSTEKDISHIEKDIKELLPDKKDNFFLLIQKKK